MPPAEDRNRIEDLKRSLYSRNAPDVRTRRKLRYSDQPDNIKTDWEHPEEVVDDSGSGAPQEKHKMSFVTKLLIASAIFCVIAVGAGAYIFWNGGNLISANNIDITMSGPVSVAGGTPISLSIVITNKNSVVLGGVDLSVHFPAGATDSTDTTQPLDTYRVSLGDLKPGESVTKVVQADLFGEQNLQKEITASVTYGISGSSSVFTKDQTYDVLINSSPINLSASSLKEITSGTPFDTTVVVKSNSAATLRGVVLKATYPFGYTFSSASLGPSSSDNATWSLGDMPAGGSRTIVIHGTLTGEDNDVRAFHFNVGSASPGNSLAIGTSFVNVESDVTIQKPFVSLSITTDNDSSTGDYVGKFGRSVNVIVNWSNNLPEAISNMVIDAHLSGTAYDKTQVTPLTGYFRSATDDIIWSQQTDPEFASVAAGAKGTVSFVIMPMDKSSASNTIVNPGITIAASATGDRTAEAGVPNSTTNISRNIKVSSNVALTGRVLRTGTAFGNTGPIPPQADRSTTYTIDWTVDNTSSAVANASVSATLPPYVSWTKQVSPSTENVTYDSNSGTVTWNIGSISAYASGGASTRREVQFQVSVEPSVDQIGQSPVIMNQSVLTATDNFTNASLQSTQGYLTTSFSTDASFQPGNGAVIKSQ